MIRLIESVFCPIFKEKYYIHNTFTKNYRYQVVTSCYIGNINLFISIFSLTLYNKIMVVYFLKIEMHFGEKCIPHSPNYYYFFKLHIHQSNAILVQIIIIF